MPDESITDAIGRGHTLSTAVADIIDNALDAKAEHVRVRLVTEDDRLVALRIRDDGSGMTSSTLQDALTLGKQKFRREGELGHFGVGLKAASLSQALTLTVYSRSDRAAPCAMRIHRGSFAGEVLDDATALEGFEWDARGPASTGTVVEWRDLESVNQSQLSNERRIWLERTITTLMLSLGLTFHRLIDDRGLRITIDTWDRTLGIPGLPRVVEPRDPFQFSVSGHPNYPAAVSAVTSDGARLEADCFIIPPRSESPSAWLLGRSPVEWQGIYVYRNDRLLQAGGWLGVRQDDRRLRLARMRIDLTGPLERHLRLRHEKSGVVATPEFTAALEAAFNSEEITLDRFRSDALEAYRSSNLRKQVVKPATAVHHGLPERVVEAVRDELGERDDDPIGMDWGMLPEGQLFEVQHDRRLIRFNLGYRSALGGEDAMVIPTLVYLLLESNFTKSRLNQVTRNQIDAWQAVTSAALLVQVGEDAYDPLANWPKIEVPRAEGNRPSIMAGPRPAPPTIPLGWAHLGHRGTLGSAGGVFTPIEGTARIPASLGSIVQSEEQASAGYELSESELQTSVDPLSSHGTSDHSEVAEETAPASHRTNKLYSHRTSPPLGMTVMAGDREIVAMYRGRADIETISTTLSVDPRDVALRLCALLLQLEGDDIDDISVAAMHGMPYTPDDRERILEMYRDQRSIRAIAAHFNRTPFAIAWQLLSSTKRPVDVHKGLLRRIDRALPAAVDKSRPSANELPLDL
jgi:hypothetical protein